MKQAKWTTGVDGLCFLETDSRCFGSVSYRAWTKNWAAISRRSDTHFSARFRRRRDAKSAVMLAASGVTLDCSGKMRRRRGPKVPYWAAPGLSSGSQRLRHAWIAINFEVAA